MIPMAYLLTIITLSAGGIQRRSRKPISWLRRPLHERKLASKVATHPQEPVSYTRQMLPTNYPVLLSLLAEFSNDSESR